jgi:hypothetical protein
VRCGCYLLVAAIGLLIAGVQGITEASKFQKKRVMTCSAFLKAPPREGWFQINGCELDLLDASFKQTKYSETITEAYIPVRSVDNPDEERIQLLLETEDEGIIKTLEEMGKIGKKDEKAARAWALKNVARLFPRRDLEGMVRHGDTRTREEVLRLTDSLNPDFVVLRQGEKPSMGLAIGMVIGGVVCGGLLLLMLLGWIGNRSADADAA